MAHPIAPKLRKSDEFPKFIYDESFIAPNAARTYAAANAADATAFVDTYMPDDVTRDTTRRMHYAAYRVSKAKGFAEQAKWRTAYYTLRDSIVLGNRKLIYRAVRRRMAQSNKADDLIGDCHIVMIQAVAAYNPWLGIRFSTYAFTCLVRALSRLSQKAANDWLSRSASLEALPDGEPRQPFHAELVSSSMFRLDVFLREDHPLLSHREKMILIRRFSLTEETAGQTLEKVGKELGLSKERVRQVQASALGKLRKVLSEEKAAV